MGIPTDKDLKQLFHYFYCDILNLYKNQLPEYNLSSVQQFETLEKGSHISSHPKIYLRSAKYYFEHTKEIQALESFQKIVGFIQNSPEILETDAVISDSTTEDNTGKKHYEVAGVGEAFAPSIYLIAQEIFEEQNKTSIQVDWDFKPVSISDMKLCQEVVRFRLTHKNSFLPAEKYFYYLQNLEVEKSFTLKMGTQTITFKKLSDVDRSLMINSSHFGSEDFSAEIWSTRTAIVSSELIDKDAMKGTLTILRIFKPGEFRLCAVGELKKGLDQEQFIKINASHNDYTRTINNRYQLRSDIVHGNSQSEMDKHIRKISFLDGKPCRHMKECLDLLEGIMRELWRQIVTRKLHQKDIEKEVF